VAAIIEEFAWAIPSGQPDCSHCTEINQPSNPIVRIGTPRLHLLGVNVISNGDSACIGLCWQKYLLFHNMPFFIGFACSISQFVHISSPQSSRMHRFPEFNSLHKLRMFIFWRISTIASTVFRDDATQMRMPCHVQMYHILLRICMLEVNLPLACVRSLSI
jgi:hypothetical protein